ncbi:GINS complex, Psf3 component [Lentinus tigrinus ALCF2SS1-7]|uniref:DNA replication complex GINS protein PSF3 n=1 Tax=Lentinus tigrinus ALCF2SS1-6 TaxID=1328759 RepID=A0A5C2SKK4_9APHY|nr:GINS complex, Psf3 component [Lentinus tigrinus ALCF2SS1-6]RPD74483.1 GINS complex, Psf3 component [Lentinus tigrinus ALCF2SS1-7]
MEDDYYSIESILAENQKIQCTFKTDVPDMGHLDGGKTGDIKALSKVQLPLWMVYILIYSDYADFTIPPPFAARVRNALNAEAKSVRLSALVGQGGLWYGFGRMIMRLLNDIPAAELSKVLTDTFHKRLPEVIDQAQHFASLQGTIGGSSRGGDAIVAAFREGMDGTERELFQLAQESAKRTKLWYEASDRGRR